MVVGVVSRVTIEGRHLGRKCSETVTADIGKARGFIPMVDELRVADIGVARVAKGAMPPQNFLKI